jgi:peptide/nickel transport system permease protein
MLALSLILRRTALLIFVLFAVSFLTFLIVHVLPGDVANAILGELATPEQVEAVRERMGLGQPVLVRYSYWIWNFLHGDFGVSLSLNAPIAPIIFGRLEKSIILAFLALGISVPISILLGTLAAVYRGTLYDRIITSSVVFFFALPEYVLALAFILIFALGLGILPGSSLVAPNTSILDNLSALVLPVSVISIHMLAYLSQITRASMIDALDAGYVRTAVLKGLPSRLIIIKHALRNAMLPTLVEIGLNFGYTLGGLVIVETVFSYAGIGQLLVLSVQTRDVPTIQATVLIVAAAYGIGNLLADVFSILLNPRLRT